MNGGEVVKTGIMTHAYLNLAYPSVPMNLDLESKDTTAGVSREDSVATPGQALDIVSTIQIAQKSSIPFTYPCSKGRLRAMTTARGG